MKRFVAGSNCPKCNSKDSLRVWSEAKLQFMDCIKCDYHQSIDNHKPSPSPPKLIGIKNIGDD